MAVDKEMAKQAWMRTFKIGRGVESLHPVSVRDAEARFERWWQQNHE